MGQNIYPLTWRTTNTRSSKVNELKVNHKNRKVKVITAFALAWKSFRSLSKTNAAMLRVPRERKVKWGVISSPQVETRFTFV